MAAISHSSRWTTPAHVAAALFAVGLLAVQVALAYLDLRGPADALYLVLFAAAAAACAVRALVRRERRLGWALVAVGVALWCAGEAEYLRAAAAGEEPSAWSDGAYLGLYVCGMAGVAAMLRRTRAGSHGLTLDAVVGGLGVATLWFWLVFSHFLSAHQAGTADFAYPVLDLAVVMVAFALVSQNRWRSAPATLAIGIAFLLAAVADSVFAVQDVHDLVFDNPLVTALWPAAALTLGFAAWMPASDPVGRPRPLPMLFTTTGATAIAVAALVWGNFSDLHAKPALVVLALLTLMASVSRGVQLYLERQRALRHVRGEGMRSVRALAAAADARDRYTRDHSRRVAVYTTAIAVELGLEIEEIEVLAMAAELHDVGKIAVPDVILLKPAKLTDAEYELIKRHSAEGERIIRAMGRSRMASWVRHHHERWDGRGYPDGLAGEHIPLQSRILAGADALDAMTTDRSYSVAFSTEGAIEELARSAGTQLDPRIAACLVGLLRDRMIRPPEGDQPLRYEIVPQSGGNLRAADFVRVLEVLAGLTRGEERRSHEIALSIPSVPVARRAAVPVKR